ncbi:hypothetical protein CC85DRAFT_302084 [Cutaneotrichosporon oleaginosum]|uniref:Uncharacterized protein n=1 Tax=Cutaneotrichosporon oleaginosum TaxID=879819 RepID=A0A0J0XNQ3_9TREE|nr:uncharacterized protein CC85DRAFT_302084 [Cutaneotrichosporon oleaginosum]KLT42760.1 hypothetical protein CC85DRAFT_302084 [Cutaneotrichosporon oleaginosum]TXT09522.1 hypothetical protein COLE_03456 [Cutaneotrichosporon oleaginosum]
MARPYSPSYNAYPYTPKVAAAPSPPTSAPRLSSHPFFVDQTPYLSSSWRLSSMSLQSLQSTSSSGSRYSPGSSSSTPSSSSISSPSTAPSPSPMSTAHLWFRKYERPRHARAASIDAASSPSPTPLVSDLTPKAASLHAPTAPIDRRCLQWMREAEQHEHEWILGSVASRSRASARAILPADTGIDTAGPVEVLHEPRACALKRRFRLNST